MEEFPKREVNDEVPFNDNLIESDISEAHEGTDKLFELENNPDKIIRVESFDDLEKRYKGQVDPITVTGLGKKLYKELEDTYSIAVPVEYVAGKNSKGEKVIYGITDRIDGENLDKIEVTPEITQEVEKLYESITRYYLDKSLKDELYLADINNASQYVYGKQKGSKISKIYLVDTDLYIRDGKVAFYNIVLWLVRHMISVEEKYDKRFDEARHNIEKILHNPLPQNISDEVKVVIEKSISKSTDYLNGKFPESDGDDDVALG